MSSLHQVGQAGLGDPVDRLDLSDRSRPKAIEIQQ